MGAAACFFLASRGRSVLGIDRFQPPHNLAAHGGQTRIIRKAYFEHPDYIPLLQKAYANWQALENLSGEKIYHETGLLYAGSSDNELLQKIKQSAYLYNIPVQNITSDKFPQLHFPSDHELLFEPEAGFLLTDTAINAYLNQAKKAGAELHQNETVIHWERKENEIIVHTDKSSYSTEKIIFTAGPFTSQLLPFTQNNLTITRQVLVWIKPNDENYFSIGNFPCWLAASDNQPGPYYGFPVIPSSISSGPQGIKLALHYPGEITDPLHVNRNIHSSDTSHLLEFIRQHIPSALGEVIDATTCLYSMTPDEHFVIDFVPGYEERACIAWGFSGHGFKFASAVGEALADLSMYGKTELPIGFLSAERFSLK